MPPEYFHRRLTMGEAADYIEGLDRRYRQAWSQARLVADVQARCAGNKNGLEIEFPWEQEEGDAEPPTEEEIEELREYQKKYENILNNE